MPLTDSAASERSRSPASKKIQNEHPRAAELFDFNSDDPRQSQRAAELVEMSAFCENLHRHVRVSKRQRSITPEQKRRLGIVVSIVKSALKTLRTRAGVTC